MAKARSVENQIHLVSSTYDMKTGVFNKTGELMAEGTVDQPVALADVDLIQRELVWWFGEFRNCIHQDRPIDHSIPMPGSSE